MCFAWVISLHACDWWGIKFWLNATLIHLWPGSACRAMRLGTGLLWGASEYSSFTLFLTALGSPAEALLYCTSPLLCESNSDTHWTQVLLTAEPQTAAREAGRDCLAFNLETLISESAPHANADESCWHGQVFGEDDSLPQKKHSKTDSSSHWLWLVEPRSMPSPDTAWLRPLY